MTNLLPETCRSIFVGTIALASTGDCCRAHPAYLTNEDSKIHFYIAQMTGLPSLPMSFNGLHTCGGVRVPNKK